MDIKTQRITAKATAILQAGGIIELTDARSFGVQGKTDLYLVTVAGDAWHCTCPSTEPGCSHTLAVRQWINMQDDPFAGLDIGY